MKYNRIFKNRKEGIGSPPGSLVHIGRKKTDTALISFFAYNETELSETVLEDIDSAFNSRMENSVNWINIDGLHDTELINRTGNLFTIHPLFLEDILNTTILPKIEIIDDQMLLIIKMISWDEALQGIESEQVSFILGSNYLISFQERPGDLFDPIRNRLRNKLGKIRKKGNDYLFYSLIDIIIDNYMVAIDLLSEKIENIEDEVLNNPVSEHTATLHDLRKELLYLRKITWPLKEISNNIKREETDLISEDTLVYFNDVSDHVIQVVEFIDVFREILIGVHDTYTSAISNRMNSIMKVLTLIATIFIPLTFIAGIYGMNFSYMPELSIKWAYFAVLLVMLIVGVSMLVFFKKKKWL